jgi:hypothetical protein
VVLWELTFSVDPRVNPHPFILRWLEPPWQDWDSLTGDEKMRIFRRRQLVHWTFVLLASAVWTFVFVFGILTSSL